MLFSVFSHLTTAITLLGLTLPCHAPSLFQRFGWPCTYTGGLDGTAWRSSTRRLPLPRAFPPAGRFLPSHARAAHYEPPLPTALALIWRTPACGTAYNTCAYRQLLRTPRTPSIPATFTARYKTGYRILFSRRMTRYHARACGKTTFYLLYLPVRNTTSRLRRCRGAASSPAVTSRAVMLRIATLCTFIFRCARTVYPATVRHLSKLPWLTYRQTGLNSVG